MPHTCIWLCFWCTLPGCLFGHTRLRGACLTLISGAHCLAVYLDTHGPEEPAQPCVLVHTAWMFIWTHTAQRSLLTLCSGACCLAVYLDTHGPEEPAEPCVFDAHCLAVFLGHTAQRSLLNLVFWCTLPGCVSWTHTAQRSLLNLVFWCTLSGCVSWTHGSKEPAEPCVLVHAA